MESKPGVMYLAGFFDGEGCIGINPPIRTSIYLLSIQVANTDVRPLQLFKDAFGGKIMGPYQRNDRHKPIYNWSVQAKKAESALLELMPHLVVKKDQAELAMRFRKLFKGKNTLPRGNAKPNEEKRLRVVGLRRECYNEMKQLNKRGA